MQVSGHARSLPPPAWGGGGEGKNFRKVFAGGGSEIYILVGGYIVGGKDNFVGGNVILK